MDPDQKQKLTRFRKWLIVQKFTLQRGYNWANIPMIGFIGAGQVKLLFPGIFNSLTRFIILIALVMSVLYAIGWIDKEYRFLHEDNAYTTETNPLMMKVVNNTPDPE
jgi:hypothetical protein